MNTSAGDRLSISVIIPTKNRDEDLRITLDSLAEQTVAPDELILIDQSDVAFRCRELPFPVHHIHNRSLSGLTAARNVSMGIATCDIWLFLDDDVVLEPNFIDEILRGYSDDVAGVSGVITNYQRPPLGRHLWNRVFLLGPFHDDRQPVYWNADALRDGGNVRVKQFGGGLMSFRQELIRTARFDECLKGACPGEDIDFCVSFPRTFHLIIAPRARLVHKQSPVARSRIHWLALDAQVNQYLRDKHWKNGIFNNLCYAWLNVGYALAASIATIKTVSLSPFQAWREGSRKGAAIAECFHKSRISEAK